VGVYFVQVIHLTGIGVMAQTITSQIGGESSEQWLAETVAIVAGTLSPPVSQAADLWGRKWFVVGFTICGAVGCLILSRANNFGQLIGGQSMFETSHLRAIAYKTQRLEHFTRALNALSMLLRPRSCRGNGVPLHRRLQQQQAVWAVRLVL
jgi:MFS family permease